MSMSLSPFYFLLSMSLSPFPSLISLLCPYSRIAPTRTIVLRGKESDCRAVADYAKASGIEAFTPNNR